MCGIFFQGMSSHICRTTYYELPCGGLGLIQMRTPGDRTGRCASSAHCDVLLLSHARLRTARDAMVGSHHKLLAHLRRDHNLLSLCALASFQQCGRCKRASLVWPRTYRSVLRICGLQCNCHNGLLFADTVLVSQAHIRLMSKTAHSRSRSRCGVKNQTRRQRKRLVRS